MSVFGADYVKVLASEWGAGRKKGNNPLCRRGIIVEAGTMFKSLTVGPVRWLSG